MTAKDLKNALLQEAVQGKLVPQIASEGNARDLLEEIRKERGESLPLATARKRSSATPSAGTPRNAPMEITEDEIPFDIPESWCWCRLGDVFQTTSGTTPQSKNPLYYDNGTIGWVRTTDLNNGILSEAEILITEKAKSDCNLKMIPTNSVCMALYGGGGTIGKNALLNFETTINQSVCALLPNKFADMKYLQFFLQWQRPHWMDYASGSRKDPNINQIIVKNCPFPLPPLAEQKRIVAAIEKFMPLIEEYGKKETVLNELNAQIGTLTKKAILQEAVQGKLVPQIPAEGNAKDLLEQIKAQKAAFIKEGKIKKEKPLPEITEDEIPFDIPENWCWCRLGELGLYRKGPFGSSLTKSMFVPKSDVSIKVYEQKNAIQKDFSLGDYYISKEKFESMQSFIVEPTDIIVSCAGTIGEVYKLPNEAPIGIINQALMRVKLVNEELASFWMMYFDYVLKKEASKQGSGTAIKNIPPFEILKAYPFPLPPLAEQKRIVAAIKQLLPLCEKLGK